MYVDNLHYILLLITNQVGTDVFSTVQFYCIGKRVLWLVVKFDGDKEIIQWTTLENYSQHP